jgi:phage terminase large subunit-like protein
MGEAVPERLNGWRAWTPRTRKGPIGPTRFNVDRAVRVRRFFEGPDATLWTPGHGDGALVHTKGKYARQPFLLSDWQWREVIAPLFGTELFDPQHGEWVRAYLLAWLEWARKNGKSELMAALGLVFLTADAEEGAEVYSAAGSKDQASFVFDVARRMVQLSPVFNPEWGSHPLRLIENTKRIIDDATGSVWRVMSKDAYQNLGADPHAVLFDEIVSQPNQELWGTLRTAFGSMSRRNPMMVAATTGGPDARVFAKRESDLSAAIAEDPRREPRRYVVIHRADEHADPGDHEQWHAANPALGDFKSVAAMEAMYREALIDTDKLADFLVFQLNLWGKGLGTPWVPLATWDRGGTTLLSDLERRIRGRDAWAGLDLSSTQDLASLCIVAPTGRIVELATAADMLLPEEAADAERAKDDPAMALLAIREHIALWRHWVPEAALPDLDKRTSGQARGWVKDGLLSVTPGNVIDYQAIAEELITGVGARVALREVAFDRWGAVGFVSALADQLAGIKLVPFGQGFASMGPAARELRRLVLAGALLHGGNALMRWQRGNVKMSKDPAGNEKPDKGRALDKIDGVVALHMAVGRAMLKPKRRRQQSGFASFGG